MTCDDVRAVLLDADPAALRATGDGALATHLRSCTSCRAHAAAILAQNDVLRGTLDAAVAARAGAAAAHASTRRALAVRADADDGAGRPRPYRARGRRIAVRALMPLAVAAALALLLFRADVTRPGASTVGFYVPEPEVPAAPVVNVSTRGGVAVMRTVDPRITVVWTF